MHLGRCNCIILRQDPVLGVSLQTCLIGSGPSYNRHWRPTQCSSFIQNCQYQAKLWSYYYGNKIQLLQGSSQLLGSVMHTWHFPASQP